MQINERCKIEKQKDDFHRQKKARYVIQDVGTPER